MNISIKLLSLAAPLALLSVASLTAATTWTGASNSDWNTAANWSNGLPNVNTSSTWPATVALDGAVVNMSAAGSGRKIQISGNGAVAPTLNITQNFTVNYNQFTVGGVDADGAAAAGYQGIVNHTAGILSIGGPAGTRRLRIAGSGVAVGDATSSYNFGGLSGSAPSLIIDGGVDGSILLGDGLGETGNLNLSGFGAIDVSGVLRAARANGTANIDVTGGNLTLDFGVFEMSEFAGAETNLNATIDSTGFSTINVAGATSFGEGDAFFNLSLGGDFSATLGETFTIVSSAGFGLLQNQTVAEFTNVAAGSTLVVDGYSFLADYDAGDFTLEVTAIPEPDTYALLAGLGALCLIMLRRDRCCGRCFDYAASRNRRSRGYGAASA